MYPKTFEYLITTDTLNLTRNRNNLLLVTKLQLQVLFCFYYITALLFFSNCNGNVVTFFDNDNYNGNCTRY